MKDLPQKKKLFWRVQAKSPAVTSKWSANGFFTTGNPPTVPVLVAPLNNALVKVYTPLFNWNNSTVPANTLFKHYEIQVDDQPDFSSLDFTATTTAGNKAESQVAPLSNLASNTKFYWRVRAVNTMLNPVTSTPEDHTSGWSPVRSFRTVVLPPTGLTATPGVLKPTFAWDDATAPISGYTIQVSTLSNFSTLLVNVTTPYSFYTMEKNLPAHKTLHWRVRVNGANGPSAWTTMQFTTP